MKPWKRKADYENPHTVRWLQWGHGDEAVEEHRRALVATNDWSRFNGATAMKPWKSMSRT